MIKLPFKAKKREAEAVGRGKKNDNRKFRNQLLTITLFSFISDVIPKLGK